VTYSTFHEKASSTDVELQRHLYVAAELLGMLNVSRIDARLSSTIANQISQVTCRIEYVVQEYEYTLSDSTQQAYHYKLATRSRCCDCNKPALNSQARSNPADTTVPVVPIWQPALNFSLACSDLAASNFMDRCDTNSLKQFPTCLVELRRMLSRLQRSLSHTRTTDTKLEVEDPDRYCVGCGKPLQEELDTIRR
jgi:hypothetical protein